MPQINTSGFSGGMKTKKGTQCFQITRKYIFSNCYWTLWQSPALEVCICRSFPRIRATSQFVNFSMVNLWKHLGVVSKFDWCTQCFFLLQLLIAFRKNRCCRRSTHHSMHTFGVNNMTPTTERKYGNPYDPPFSSASKHRKII